MHCKIASFENNPFASVSKPKFNYQNSIPKNNGKILKSTEEYSLGMTLNDKIFLFFTRKMHV